MNKINILSLLIVFFSVFAVGVVDAENMVLNYSSIIGDSDVRGDQPNTNYGSSTDLLVKWGTPKRITYVQFNLSSFPTNQIIDSAQACLYLYRDQGEQTISIYQVYSNWLENTITWNNQPCGSDFNNDTNCNLTGEDSFVSNGDLDEKWVCFDIEDMITNQYNKSYNNLSFALYTSDSGNADMFYSKEFSDLISLPYINITYHSADVTPPQFSNIIESPENNSAYSSSQIYRFNTTITDDTSIDSAWIEFNNINYSASGSEVFSFSISGLSAGIYSYRWWANDTYGNFNSSGLRSYTVGKADSGLLLTSSSGWSFVYGTETTFSCSAESGTPKLYINSVESVNPLTTIMSAGSYNIKCNISESQNYSSGLSQGTLIISKAQSSTSIVFDEPSPILYGEGSNFSCFNSASLTTILYINGVDKSEEKELEIIRAAGNYVVNCTSISNENYTSSSQQEEYLINQADGDIRLYLNGEEADLTIEYPQEYNITASSLYGSTSIYKDGVDVSAENGLNVTPLDSGFYNITAFSNGDENHSLKSITRWLNITRDIVLPEIIIYSPQEGATYGYKTGLSLNFSVFDIHLDSCWYNLNNGENITIDNCENTTFDLGADGNYALYLYANDSFGNIGIGNSTFTLLEGAPTIILDSPINIYLNSNEVIFRYTPSDLDLDSCELWGNFNGSFLLNQTGIAVSDEENIFTLNLSDGTYKWNIRCNDSFGHSAFNANTTFYVDTALPQISISQPTGEKTSRNNIPISFSIDDRSPSICKYNIYRGLNLEIDNTTISCASSSLFSVTLDADFVLNLYATDAAGNINSASSSFSVDTSVVNNPPADDDGGGGGGSGSIGASQGISVDIAGLGDVVFSPGESKSLSVSVKNKGASFLNSCRLVGKGEYAGWISGKESKGLAAGQIVEFVFDLNAPIDAEVGNYDIELAFNCNEGAYTDLFSVSIVQAKLSLSISELRASIGMLEFDYIIRDLSETNQNVSLSFSLVDYMGVEVASDSKIIELTAKEIKEERIIVTIPDDLVGEHTLILNAESNVASTSAREKVLLGSGGTGTGLALLSREGQRAVPIIIVIIVLFVVGYFIIRRVFKNKFVGQQKGGIIKINHNKKGVMIIDSDIIEHAKRHAESNDVKDKWIHFSAKKRDAPDRI